MKNPSDIAAGRGGPGRRWLPGIALLAACAGMPAQAGCPAPPGSLATQQRDARQALRLEQQTDLDRARAQGLPSTERLRQYELTIEQRGEQKYLHDQQQLEQTIRNSRSGSRPAQPGSAEQPLQRYRLEDAERQHDFRMQRDQR